ncbi:MAG: beta-Ig-H3/fasciclin, partial [Euryarchaeota archaeon]|nr:beta-Ig-H3/fasciclin [Euryarchaeota archaeon]
MMNTKMIMPLIVGVYVTFAIAAMSITPIVAADDTEDIPTNAQATGVHDSLVAALEHAGLVTALQADGPFTVFAPTDEAFAAAGIDLATFDTDEENATLADILTYHVYSGSVQSSAVTDGMTVTMLNGDKATFTVTDGTVKIGEATVTQADVMAANGVIHVIDRVLSPPVDQLDVPATAGDTGVHTSLVAALIQANLVTALQADGPFTVFAPTDEAFAAAGIDL